MRDQNGFYRRSLQWDKRTTERAQRHSQSRATRLTSPKNWGVVGWLWCIVEVTRCVQHRQALRLRSSMVVEGSYQEISHNARLKARGQVKGRKPVLQGEIPPTTSPSALGAMQHQVRSHLCGGIRAVRLALECLGMVGSGQTASHSFPHSECRL